MKKIIIMAAMVAALVGCKAEQPQTVQTCRANVAAYFNGAKIDYLDTAINPGRVNMSIQVGPQVVQAVCHFNGEQLVAMSTSDVPALMIGING